ncbi:MULTISPECIES: HK97-gp10 family putative phage morphogenesis protein [Comamonas]|uniref:HK97-gp10 family putative phage morphogenesis protein n=1 Tax=Comamonas TaxID=283 RepID=UPI0001DA6912|nr:MULTISPECIES: HK97-gp10 family putative phage morphogenesis protein [Comamonas]EFI59768.1 hypothetical protein CTS44_20778 [Comamonas thiooxydans]MBL5979047.1 HK97 gp10 family phage protein [Comamonas sp. NyZ500]TFF58286.1 hypothetical protein EIC84_16330 [Comamonas sp. A23]
MADIQFKLTGFDEVSKRLQALPVELRKKPARSALGKAATLVRGQAQTNAIWLDDKATGRKIADNIIQRFRSRYSKRTGDVMISVGVGTEKGRIPKGNPDEGPKGNTPHWHLLELGTEQAKPQPFLRPAAEQQAEAAIALFGTELDKAITRLVRRMK